MKSIHSNYSNEGGRGGADGLIGQLLPPVHIGR
jgi:hypothetical protein